MVKEYRHEICVAGGAGHVGLPLSIAFADKGLDVIIYDINQDALDTINSGTMPFNDEGADEKLARVIGNNLHTTTSPECIRESRFLVVIIGTPVDEHLNPNFRVMRNFFDRIMPYMHNGQVVILRSTVYPGTTKKINTYLKEHYSGINVCFCPERIAEGKAMTELYTLPQIVSGFEPVALKETAALFNVLTNEVIITNPLEAELAKLFSNSWRYIQFATANQFYMIAEEYGADFYEVYNAMTYNYPRNKNFPKPGFAAGPCLFKDTMQISAFANNKFFLGHSAMLINEGMPNFVIGMIKKEYELSNMTAAILGMAFKADSDDPRESLSFKLRKLLEIEAKMVLCSDEYITAPDFISAEECIMKSDIIIIGAPHKEYRYLDYREKPVIDIWDFVETVISR